VPRGLQWIDVRTPALLLGILVCGCAPEGARTYPIHGQILGISSPTSDGRVQITLKHDDIRGFMPAMTMAYNVGNASAAAGLATGDVIDAALVVDGSDVHLEKIRKAGRAPLPSDAKPAGIMDVMQPGDLVPDDPVIDQTGATHKLSDWRGRVLAVTFVYTRCPLPDFCPAMDRRFAALQKAIKNDATLSTRAHLVTVSFDPAHDTPAAIRRHAEARGADPAGWSYVTGSKAAIAHLTSRFGVSAIAGEADTITHNLRTAIVDPDGRLVTVYSGNDWTPDALLNDLRAHAR
jgi:protein SCO1/2